MQNWIVVVDGFAYGFFGSETDAKKWASESFPVAFTQKRIQYYQFHHA